METTKLKRFAQYARRSLIEQVSAKLKLVLSEDSAARRESVAAVKKLEEAIQLQGKDQVIERVAYIWFNRFCALRFMDVNRYNRVGIVSPADPGQFQPEILAEAKMGHIDEEMVHDKIRQQIFALLDGKAPSRDPQGEAYRLLVVAACNYWNKAMPFLFERIEDYTELLMPDDLLSGNSILAYTREAMTPETCEDVEVIGWLYQFYISEKKDEVFDGLKKNKKITPENIPAATQLFTPHWIVRYLVENSLGRLWLLNRPGSKLAGQMDYYIKPEQPETDFLRISKPEEIKICDPACGSGHMLTYAFDLLYAIYEEEGYEPAEIPEKILTHNLYGIEIDERAGELAAFALTMKARAKQRRFFNKGVKPNICVLENVHFDEDELKEYMDFVGRDLFTLGLENTLRQFEEADNFGSLIRPEVTDVDSMLQILELKNVSGHLFLSLTHQKVLQALRQADYLSAKYHVVIANPPYMGSKGANTRLASWSKRHFPRGKTDTFAMFIERGLELVPELGYSAMVTMQSWMFLSSYEALREYLLEQSSIQCLAHMANMVMGIAFGTSATVWKKQVNSKQRASCCFIEYEDIGIDNKPVAFPPRNSRNMLALREGNDEYFYKVALTEFSNIPGKPIAYWAPKKLVRLFQEDCLDDHASVRQGMATTDNERFLRGWYEISFNKIGFGFNTPSSGNENGYNWFPYNKGGEFRKWYGNFYFIINYEKNGQVLIDLVTNKYPKISDPEFVIKNRSYYCKEAITWSDVTSGATSFRYVPKGMLFDGRGSCIFSDEVKESSLISCLNTPITLAFAELLNPTAVLNPGEVKKLPILPRAFNSKTAEIGSHQIYLAKSDWDFYETSWDFTGLPMLNPDYRQLTLTAAYQKLRTHWQQMTLEMQRLEEENNRIFIEAYGLQDELDKKVELSEITLTCNPHYRYGGDKSEDELEALLLADTIRELVSYAVGCMFGRYALDKPGLILTNQGETLSDYLKQIPEPSFPADDDNVIPMLDGDWFTDDITERFRHFLRVAFGEAHYEENLKFVEQALNVKGKREYSIRDYFLGEFYTDHIKRYKKRPIYWLFSSPKGSFNALIYMHRYRPDTVSVVLNDYLREFRTKLTAHKNHLEAVSISASAAQGEKTKALKEIEKINKIIAELEEYEREVLYPLATQQIDIDLDDGVKANYPKFGAALKKIPGLDAQDE
jgi:type II restriction/modification system DNA methylase subunit YeeA